MKKLAKNIAVFVLYFTFIICSLAAQAEGDDYDYDDDDFSDFFEAERDIVIVGAPETTGQMTVIGREAIEKSAARDLAMLLEEEIDMSIVSLGGYGNRTSMNLRGFSTERIAILIDGVPANSPRSGDFDINQIDLNSVERVEVTYGGSDTKYNVSGAMGGVINIITVKKQKPGHNFGFAFTNTGYIPGRHNKKGENKPMDVPSSVIGPDYIDLVDMQALSLFFGGVENEIFSWKTSLFGNIAGNHYLYKDEDGFARRKVSNEVKDGGGNAQFMFVLPKDAHILFDTKLYYAHRHFPITAHSVGNALAKDLVITENIVFAAPVIWDDFATEGSVTYQSSNNNYGAKLWSRDHFLTGINRWSWYPADNITVRSGVDWRFVYINTNISLVDEVKTGNQGGLYLTGEYKPVKNLLFVASVKGVTDTKQLRFVPKAGLSWKINPYFTLKNNYFRSFKFPDFDDMYYRSLDGMYVGNPNLKPEDGWGTDLIGELTLEKYFSFTSAAFWQNIKDSIHWMRNPGGRWNPENVGVARFAGVDFRPMFVMPLDIGILTSLKIGTNYQFQYSWLKFVDVNGRHVMRVPYMPSHIIGGSVDLGWKTGSFLISAHFESLRYAEKTNTEELAIDPNCIAHATLNQNLGKNFTFFASLRNILNVKYQSFLSYDMPGTSLVIGIKAKFEFPRKEKVSSQGDASPVPEQELVLQDEGIDDGGE